MSSPPPSLPRIVPSPTGSSGHSGAGSRLAAQQAALDVARAQAAQEAYYRANSVSPHSTHGYAASGSYGYASPVGSPSRRLAAAPASPHSAQRVPPALPPYQPAAYEQQYVPPRSPVTSASYASGRAGSVPSSPVSQQQAPLSPSRLRAQQQQQQARSPTGAQVDLYSSQTAALDPSLQQAVSDVSQSRFRSFLPSTSLALADGSSRPVSVLVVDDRDVLVSSPTHAATADVGSGPPPVAPYSPSIARRHSATATETARAMAEAEQARMMHNPYAPALPDESQPQILAVAQRTPSASSRHMQQLQEHDAYAYHPDPQQLDESRYAAPLSPQSRGMSSPPLSPASSRQPRLQGLSAGPSSPVGSSRPPTALSPPLSPSQSRPASAATTAQPRVLPPTDEQTPKAVANGTGSESALTPAPSVVHTRVTPVAVLGPDDLVLQIGGCFDIDPKPLLYGCWATLFVILLFLCVSFGVSWSEGYQTSDGTRTSLLLGKYREFPRNGSSSEHSYAHASDYHHECRIDNVRVPTCLGLSFLPLFLAAWLLFKRSKDHLALGWRRTTILCLGVFGALHLLSCIFWWHGCHAAIQAAVGTDRTSAYYDVHFTGGWWLSMVNVFLTFLLILVQGTAYGEERCCVCAW